MTKSVSLESREARKRLAGRHAPYWRSVTPGVAIGFRKTAKHAEWYVRRFIGGRYKTRKLGSADDTLAADGTTVLSWRNALEKALDPEAAIRPQRGAARTVGEVAGLYFKDREAGSRSPGSVAHDRFRFAAFIAPEFGDRAVEDVTTADLRNWLSGLVTEDLERHVVRIERSEARKRLKQASEAIISDDAAVDPRERQRRAQAYANRTWTVMRAILNYAFKVHECTKTDVEWRKVKPFKNVDRPRLRVLGAPEAIALLQHLRPDHADLAMGALYTGLRLGELLNLAVCDVQAGVVHVREAKGGKSRHVPLNSEGHAFFNRRIHGKSATDSVFGFVDNGAVRVSISRAMRRACIEAKIPAAVFHDFRRSYGSLLLNSGASLDQIRVALGHSDSRMTIRAYAHLRQDTLAKAIQLHLPSFSLDEKESTDATVMTGEKTV